MNQTYTYPQFPVVPMDATSVIVSAIHSDIQRLFKISELLEGSWAQYYQLQHEYDELSVHCEYLKDDIEDLRLDINEMKHKKAKNARKNNARVVRDKSGKFTKAK